MDPPGVSRKRQGPSPPDTHRKRYQSYPAPGADIIDLCGDDSSPPAPKAPQISSRFPQRPHYVSAPWSGTQGNPFLIDADEYALDESGHVEEVTNRSHSLGMATAVLSFPGCDQSAVDGMQAAQGLARQAVYSRPLPLSSPFEVPYRSTMQTNLVQSAPDVVPLTEPILCKEQADLVELILSGANVFYTGSAGCGKSTVLKAFVRRFKERGMRVDIVAPTGRAALDINGSTTWTYAGWTPDAHKKPLKKLKEAAHGKYVRKRLRATDVLVVDEVSMVENLHFERLNELMKEARGSDRAFGGVQLVVTGDFCQLPPVKPFQHCITCGKTLRSIPTSQDYHCPEQHGPWHDRDKWAFRSNAWEECNFEHVNLTNIHRQSDEVFIKILQKLRIGRPLLPAETYLLENHESETENAMQLFSTREEVKRVNDRRFNELHTPAFAYNSLDHFRWSEKHQHLKHKGARLPDGSLLALRDHKFDSQIRLKKGMLVVLLINLDINSGLVNGSQGTIEDFEEYDVAKLPKRMKKGRDEEVAKTDLAGNQVLAGDHATYREFKIKEFIEGASHKAWPIVKFLNGVTRTIYADCTVNELGDEEPYSLLSRTQIPLLAAWAMTTHKSQGMTLNRVIVDLSRSFEQGQAYVALSRATSLKGLKVVKFPASAMGTGNEEVLEFLRVKFNIDC